MQLSLELKKYPYKIVESRGQGAILQGHGKGLGPSSDKGRPCLCGKISSGCLCEVNTQCFQRRTGGGRRDGEGKEGAGREVFPSLQSLGERIGGKGVEESVWVGEYREG